MSKNALVIGATGLLGHGVVFELYKCGWKVRAIGIESFASDRLFPKEVEYLCGDFYDNSFLSHVLEGIDKVFFFLSSTFPSTSSDSLELEISRTLRGLDYLLRKMRDMGVCEVVFPSSGGTVYGNIESGSAFETDALRPVTPYGFGKKMCEDVLWFYSQFGISSTILRVGNVYGTPLARKTSQGVIDLFIQKAINGEKAIIWGEALTHIRDYIFVEDFSRAIALVADYKSNNVEVYNLGFGRGISLREVIDCINKNVDSPLEVRYIENDLTAAIKRIVLDVSKLKRKTGWEPIYDIEAGIKKTIEKKLRGKTL